MTTTRASVMCIAYTRVWTLNNGADQLAAYQNYTMERMKPSVPASNYRELVPFTLRWTTELVLPSPEVSL